jgi:hypothetical protein
MILLKCKGMDVEYAEEINTSKRSVLGSKVTMLWSFFYDFE